MRGLGGDSAPGGGNCAWGWPEGWGYSILNSGNTILNGLDLNPYFISGFADAESTFVVLIAKTSNFYSPPELSSHSPPHASVGGGGVDR